METPWTLAGKPVVVVGLARSGVAAALFLARHGEARSWPRTARGRRELRRGGPEASRQPECGSSWAAIARSPSLGAALVVVSPGVPWDLPELDAARAAGVPVLAEIELAHREPEGPVAAITGTKGKSTTTAALGAMLREAGRDARVGGNIGEALTSLVEGSTDGDRLRGRGLELPARRHPRLPARRSRSS